MSKILLCFARDEARFSITVVWRNGSVCVSPVLSRPTPGKKLLQCFWCEVTTGKLRYSSGIYSKFKKKFFTLFQIINYAPGSSVGRTCSNSCVWKDRYPSMIFVVTLICKKRWKDSFALDSYIVATRDHCELKYALSV